MNPDQAHRSITEADRRAKGGIEAWISLELPLDSSVMKLRRLRNVLPGVRFAVDTYVNFARARPWQEAASAASLTELFAPEIHKNRLAGWPQHYPSMEVRT